MAKQWWALTVAIGLSIGGVALANDETKDDKGNAHDRITYPNDDTNQPIDEQTGDEKKLPNEEPFQPDLQSGQDSIDLSTLKGEKAMELQRKLQEKGAYNGAIDGQIGPATKKALADFQKEQGIEGSGKLDAKTASALGLSLSDLQPVSGEEEKSDTPTDPQSGTESDTGMDTETQTDTQSGSDTGSLESDTQSGSDSSTKTDAQSGSEPSSAPSATAGAADSPEGQVDPQSGSVDIPKQDISAAQEKLSKLGFFAGEPTGSLDAETMNAVRKFQRSKGIPETGMLDEQTNTALGVKASGSIQHQSGTESDTSVDTQSGTDTQSETDTQSGTDTQSDSADVEADTQSGMDVEAGAEGDVDTQSGSDTSTETETQEGTGSQYGGTQTEGTGNDAQIDPQVGTDATQSEMTFDKDTIKKVEQAFLVRRIDVRMNGVLDKSEKKALKRFQKENGLTPTGKLDTETLAKLGIKAPEDVNRNKGDVENPNTNTTDPMTPPTDDSTTQPVPEEGGTNPTPR